MFKQRTLNAVVVNVFRKEADHERYYPVIELDTGMFFIDSRWDHASRPLSEGDAVVVAYDKVFTTHDKVYLDKVKIKFRAYARHRESYEWLSYSKYLRGQSDACTKYYRKAATAEKKAEHLEYWATESKREFNHEEVWLNKWDIHCNGYGSPYPHIY